MVMLLFFLSNNLFFFHWLGNFPLRLLSDAECLFPHAKVGEDVLKRFLGGDALFARDFCKVVDDDAEIFGKEVAT